MVYVTYVISACICATAMIFFRFVRFLGQGIHSIATRVTLAYDLETQGHVMVYVKFVIFRHLYVSYRNEFFVFSGLQVKEFILTIAICVTITCDLGTEGPVMVYVL